MDGDGFASWEVGGPDCDDFNPEINPDTPEVCDGLDNNCNGTSDEGIFVDLDGDGYPGLECVFGQLVESIDCDDTDPSINPGAEEIPFNGIDENCDGFDL